MPRATSRDGFYTYTSSSDIAARHCTVVGVGGISHILSATVMFKGDSAQLKMLVLDKGNKFKTDKGQLILKCPFGVIKSPKKSTKFFFRISALASKKRLNQKTLCTMLNNP